MTEAEWKEELWGPVGPVADAPAKGWIVCGDDSVMLCLGGKTFWIGNRVRVKQKTEKKKG